MNFDIDKIIDEIPDDMSNLEKIRDIYLKCGELFAYNRDYVYSDSLHTSSKIYEEEFKWSMVQNRKKDRIKVTCNQIATGCTEAINRLIMKGKIKGTAIARNIGYVQGEEFHVATLVYIDNKVYFLDLYKDLYKIQKGMQTKYFAPSKGVIEEEKVWYKSIRNQLEGIECETIPEEELKKMDQKNGYCINGVYMDDALIQLKKEMEEIDDINEIKKYVGDIEGEDREDLLFKFKLEFINKYLMNRNLDNPLDINELTKFYMKAYYTLLSEKEINQSMLIPIDIHFKGEPSVLFDIYTKNELIHYIYKGKKDGFQRINDKELFALKGNENRDVRFDTDGIEK